MLMNQGGLRQPDGLRSLLAANLSEMGFRELNRGRLIALAVLVGIVGFAGVFWLAMTTHASRWWWVLAFLVVYLLATMLPSLLRTMWFQGPDGFVCRLLVTRLQDEVQLELMLPGSLQPLATTRFPDDEWREPAGIFRRGCPEYLAHLTGLLARGYRKATGHSLVSRLADKPRSRTRELALMGHLARGFRNRQGRLLSVWPVLPLPRASQIAIAALIAMLVQQTMNPTDGPMGAILIGILGALILGIISVPHPFLRLHQGDERLYFGFERKSGRLQFHVRKSLTRHPSTVVTIYPSRTLNEDLDLARPDALDEALSELTARAAPSVSARA